MMGRARLMVTSAVGATLVLGLGACDATGPTQPPASSSAMPAGLGAVTQTDWTGPIGPCNTATGPFHTSGGAMYAANGTRYLPYGMTVDGLAEAGYQPTVAQDRLRIDASAHSWCANTVRLQLRQNNLVGAGPADANSFLTAVRQEITEAEKNHLVVVLNDETDSDGGTGENNPTQHTLTFWRALISALHPDSQVLLEVFNEPRVGTDCGQASTWQLWQHGGSIGKGQPYLGMQQVVDAVRAAGATNLLWVDGPCRASTLSKADQYQLTGGPLAYDLHHPAGGHTPADWDAAFGPLLHRNIAPVLDGEWTNRSSGDSTNCWPDAYTAVPNYLNYLSAHHIGLVAYQLTPGYLIHDYNNNFTDTTHTYQNWTCHDGGRLDEGAGNLVMGWFQQHNQVTGH